MPNPEVPTGAEASPLIAPQAGAAQSRSARPGEWIASSYADVQAILADGRFEVPLAAGAEAAVGTISWLRAAASRFANGPDHARRRTLVVEQLQQLDPDELRSAADQRTQAVLGAAGRRGDHVDVMARIARRVPMAVMAAGLGIADPDRAAEAVIAIAGCYLAGPNAQTRPAADAATAQLVGMFGPVAKDVIVARITLLVQGCDGTAGLIGTALHILQDAAAVVAGWPTDAVLNEALRHSPPVRLSRRVARVPVDLGGCQVQAGDTVLCSVGAANRDPAAFGRPADFDPGRRGRPSMTFGYGIRPCPGQAQALMLAAGVIDAVRLRCEFRVGQEVSYEPSVALRIPRRLDVVLA
jgi:cytochrome P450